MKTETFYWDQAHKVSLTAYLHTPSPEMPNLEPRPAMIVLPGGAYLNLSDREAEPIAMAYFAAGFQAFVLRYSLREKARYPAPLREVEKSISLLREKREEWGIHPDRIALCGFSAGGHLAGMAACCGDPAPNAVVLSYPCVDLELLDWDDPMVREMLSMLLGPEQAHPERLSVNRLAHPKMPPVFLWHTFEDGMVDVRHTTRLADALAEKKVPFEYHLFEKGVHGLSLAVPETSSGLREMVDPDAAQWFSLSLSFLRRHFGRPDFSHSLASPEK